MLENRMKALLEQAMNIIGEELNSVDKQVRSDAAYRLVMPVAVTREADPALSNDEFPSEISDMESE